MTLAFLCGPEPAEDDGAGAAAFHAAFPVMRHHYGRVAQWTGLDTAALLHGRGAPAGRVALATAMLGIHDVLAVHGIRPAVLGGLGVGALVSACLARALPRQDLIGLLLDSDSGDAATLGGTALAFLPAGHDPAWYWAADPGSVRTEAMLGLDPSGRYRVLLLTGARAALEKLAAEAPPGAVRVHGGNGTVLHSPLGRQADGIPFTAPALPLCCGPDGTTLTTADDVARLFRRTTPATADLDAMLREMHGHGTRLALVLGPSLPRNLVRFPFPVVHIESPGDISAAISAILDFGVRLPTAS
ncbi:hypothetical protein [Peterkaempfera bronchialis]|uniref:hypothetical protein n=1 Tax=Peterkaempfera bronchialis TaxID=2126346 RepID=UPI003C2BBF38